MMCQSGAIPKGWLRRFEQITKAGDYLWLREWGCGCVIRAGVCWVTKVSEGSDWQRDCFQFTSVTGDRFAVSWEGQIPDMDGDKPIIHWLRRIALPPGYDSLGLDDEVA